MSEWTWIECVHLLRIDILSDKWISFVPLPPPSNNCKWSFMGIHSLKCKNLGGDYYWERGTAQDIISAIFAPLAHWLGFVACLRMPIVLLLGWDTKPVPYPIGFCSERIVLMPVIDFFYIMLISVVRGGSLKLLAFLCIQTQTLPLKPSSVWGSTGLATFATRRLWTWRVPLAACARRVGSVLISLGFFFDMEVQSHMTLHMFDIQNQSQMIYGIWYKYTYII